MNKDFSWVIEVEECGTRRANQLLAAGYRIIDTAQKSWEQTRRVHGEGLNQTFIAHDMRFFIGRSVDQPPFPAREAREQREPVAAGEQA